VTKSKRISELLLPRKEHTDIDVKLKEAQEAHLIRVELCDEYGMAFHKCKVEGLWALKSHTRYFFPNNNVEVIPLKFKFISQESGVTTVYYENNTSIRIKR